MPRSGEIGQGEWLLLGYTPLNAELTGCSPFLCVLFQNCSSEDSFPLQLYKMLTLQPVVSVGYLSNHLGLFSVLSCVLLTMATMDKVIRHVAEHVAMVKVTAAQLPATVQAAGEMACALFAH